MLSSSKEIDGPYLNIPTNVCLRLTSSRREVLFPFKGIVHSFQKDFTQSSLIFVDFIIGNKAMQSKLYPDAIELYSFAIALCEDNAVYYCNRCVIITLMEESDYRFLHAKILLPPFQFM